MLEPPSCQYMCTCMNGPLSNHISTFALLTLQSSLTPGMQQCYKLLSQTSRSFAAVIQALDDDLR